jgi:hypothetical protein
LWNRKSIFPESWGLSSSSTSLPPPSAALNTSLQIPWPCCGFPLLPTHHPFSIGKGFSVERNCDVQWVESTKQLVLSNVIQNSWEKLASGTVFPDKSLVSCELRGINNRSWTTCLAKEWENGCQVHESQTKKSPGVECQPGVSCWNPSKWPPD